MYYSTEYKSPIGILTPACDKSCECLIGLWVKGQKYYGGTIKEEFIRNDEIPLFHKTKDWLDRYFKGERPDPSEIPLAPEGSKFRQEVWKLLREIPYGSVTTYGDIAKKVATNMGRKSMSGQAIGGAVGHNPISIIIPCHRVVGSDGSLTGFASGIENKIKLLKLEGVDTSLFFIRKKGSAKGE
ncbi:MAG: methylated-DNA--[protein]-cysteine S-methyltransferase [Clostridia bacterium]|nr:methylated-DNA--[protein]-cysteine S-methyltransferase [Clostridiaceae bacterium]